MGPIIFGVLAILVWVAVKKLFFSARQQRRDLSSLAGSEKLARFGVGARRQSQRAVVLERPNITPSAETTKVLYLLDHTTKNVFLTGKAGTGKSTLLKYFRATTPKNVVVVAPTGVAAINVQGQTIHRFFRFKPDVTLDKVVRRNDPRDKELYKNIDTLVIDEISMVRADLLDCMDKFLRLNAKDETKPFGGVQVIAIGDLFQLPPVVKDDERSIFTEGHYRSPFFFDAHCFSEADFNCVELTKVFRQKDAEFVRILDAIRIGKATDEDVAVINTRVDESYDESQQSGLTISLVPTNRMAAEINARHLDNLPSKARVYQGSIIDEFPERDLPTAYELVLKPGAQVMLLNNDPKGRWVNGDLAKVVSLGELTVRVSFADGSFDDIARHTWDMIRFVYNERERKITSQSVGSFTQFPLKLSWAMTMHKAQGKTYENVVIDFGSGTFAPGQAYVALSRCKSLGGLILKSPLHKSYIFTDPTVKQFMHTIVPL